MAYEMREGSGSLFKNDRKRPDKNDPDYTGRCLVGGVEMQISAWIKDGQRGKWMSLSFRPAEERQSRRGFDPRTRRDIDDSEAPF